MYRLPLVTAAAVAVAFSSAAQAGTPYAGIETGLLAGRSNDIDQVADFTTGQTPASPMGPAGPADQEFDDAFSIRYARGFDAGLIAGYDFGFIRTEVEVGHRQAALGSRRPDDISAEFLDSVNNALNRPSAAPDPGAPGLPELATQDFDPSGKIRVSSAMINALLDLGLTDRISVYGGGGYGRSWVRALGDKDSDEAWQYIVGVRYKLTDHVELGLKHRYFNSGIIRLRHSGVGYAGNPNRLTITPPGGAATDIDQTTNLLLRPEIEGKFRSRSFLASLIYNF